MTSTKRSAAKKGCVKLSISMPHSLAAHVEKAAAEKAPRTISAYVQRLIEADMEQPMETAAK